MSSNESISKSNRPVFFRINPSLLFIISLLHLSLQSIPFCHSFLLLSPTKNPHHNSFIFTTSKDEIPETNNNNENDEEKPAILPMLPPPKNQNDIKSLNQSSKEPVAFVGSHKFEIQYTCNLCDTRNSHKVSRIAYRNGVVIAVCKGCMAKHLIADNLGWHNYIGGFEGDANIEEYLEARGRGEDVNRVGRDVWELESLLEETMRKERKNEGGEVEGFE